MEHTQVSVDKEVERVQLASSYNVRIMQDQGEGSFSFHLYKGNQFVESYYYAEEFESLKQMSEEELDVNYAVYADNVIDTICGGCFYWYGMTEGDAFSICPKCAHVDVYIQ